MHIAELVGQLSNEGEKTLLIYGPLGVFCAWLMFRVERMGGKVLEEIRGLAHRIDGITRAMLADMIDREAAGDRTKKFAREMLAKIEARDNRDDSN